MAGYTHGQVLIYTIKLTPIIKGLPDSNQREMRF